MNDSKLPMCVLVCAAILSTAILPGQCLAQEQGLKTMIYDPGQLKPVDSQLRVKVGDPAPPFSLPSLTAETISLAQYKGTRNVVISFVPAAWTPVCSDQWPGYNIAKAIFEQYDAILLGITVDNLPTLYAWTRQMGELWFPVLSGLLAPRRGGSAVWCASHRRDCRTRPVRHRQGGHHSLPSGFRHQPTPQSERHRGCVRSNSVTHERLDRPTFPVLRDNYVSRKT